METAPYIDIHTHHLPCGEAGHIAIRNHIIGYDTPPENSSGFFSAGIHPAYLSEDQEKNIYLEIAGLLHYQNLLTYAKQDSIACVPQIWPCKKKSLATR